MKVTPEQVNIFINNIRETGEYGTALQAVFDTFPTEPTPEQVDRAAKVLAEKAYFPYAKTIKDALRAAMTEPSSKVYPYAEPDRHGPANSVHIRLSPVTGCFVVVPQCMEFDYETLTMRMKK